MQKISLAYIFILTFNISTLEVHSKSANDGKITHFDVENTGHDRSVVDRINPIEQSSKPHQNVKRDLRGLEYTSYYDNSAKLKTYTNGFNYTASGFSPKPGSGHRDPPINPLPFETVDHPTVSDTFPPTGISSEYLPAANSPPKKSTNYHYTRPIPPRKILNDYIPPSVLPPKIVIDYFSPSPGKVSTDYLPPPVLTHKKSTGYYYNRPTTTPKSTTGYYYTTPRTSTGYYYTTPKTTTGYHYTTPKLTTPGPTYIPPPLIISLNPSAK